MTPTARTLALLRRCGYVAAVVERWLPLVNLRRDLFGCADVLAVAAHVAHRLAKAKGRPALRTWLSAGGAFEVWGWARRGQRWAVRRVAVRGDELRCVTLDTPPRRRRSARQPELFP
jgi:hypothetical protein